MNNADLLARRARDLARPTVADARDATVALVSFTVGQETYAVPAHTVAGVFRLSDLAALPGVPPAVAGVTVWRGRLVTVLDPRVLLGLTPAGRDDRTWVVALSTGGPPRGLLAAGVDGVREWPAASLIHDAVGHDAVVARTTDAVLVLNPEVVLAPRIGPGEA